ncbi:hypothetical protein BD769DRAFT_734636 [Suillus cothurnatus]|nr:hypothetical protein BD769DRAFT_734636 [Suillus cothurnatus]
MLLLALPLVLPLPLVLVLSKLLLRPLEPLPLHLREALVPPPPISSVLALPASLVPLLLPYFSRFALTSKTPIPVNPETFTTFLLLIIYLRHLQRILSCLLLGVLEFFPE